MKGYWYIVAISVGIGGLSIIHDTYLFIVFLCLWLFYLYYNERLGKLPLIVSLFFCLFFMNFIPAKETATQSTISSNSDQYIGKIVSPLLITDQRLEFTLENKNQEKILILYFINDELIKSDQKQISQLKYGATCKVVGEIELPNKSRNPGQFDYRDYLLSKGISHQMMMSSLDDLSCKGSSPLHILYSMREDIMNYITLKLSDETGAWFNALVLGNDSNISENTIELFQRWSISHLLAISGLHVGLITGLIYFILVKLNIVTKEKAQWLMIIFLPMYAFLAGGEPSVWRASSMFLLLMIFNKIKLKFSVTDILSIAFLVLLFFDKYMIYHIGFQLSFIVTFGLILSRRLIANTESDFFRVLQISFIAQMMILPLQINYFSTFQPLSILLNTFVVPYFSLFVMPYMFLLMILLPLPNFFINAFDSLFIKIHTSLLLIIEKVDQLFNFPFVIGDFPLLFSFIYYGLFFIMMTNLQKDKLLNSFKYGCVMTGLIIFVYLKPYMSPTGTVTMLDIGQGDAFVIELPYRKGVFMIDAGSRFSFTDFHPSSREYKQIIKPYLYSRGIQNIDAIFLSHKDIDHMGSFQYLIEDFNVNKLIISEYYELDEEELFVLNENNIQVKRIKASQNINIRDQQFFALAPFHNENSENDNSLVIFSELGGKFWLFTGDIGKDIERQIASEYDLAVDILKVAHHGSNTSTDKDFLSTINPSVALIPVGVNNSYGHPTPEVIERLEEQGVKVFRTDQDGAVQYHYQKNIGTFSKFLP